MFLGTPLLSLSQPSSKSPKAGIEARNTRIRSALRLPNFFPRERRVGAR